METLKNYAIVYLPVFINVVFGIYVADFFKRWRSRKKGVKFIGSHIAGLCILFILSAVMMFFIPTDILKLSIVAFAITTAILVFLGYE
jgi:hypothetical protein